MAETDTDTNTEPVEKTKPPVKKGRPFKEVQGSEGVSKKASVSDVSEISARLAGKLDSYQKVIMTLPEGYFVTGDISKLSTEGLRNIFDTYEVLSQRKIIPPIVCDSLSAHCFHVSDGVFKFIVDEFRMTEGFSKAEARIHKRDDKGALVFTMEFQMFKDLAGKYMKSLESLQRQMIREVELIGKERNTLLEELESVLT